MSIRFLANENIPGDAVKALAAAPTLTSSPGPSGSDVSCWGGLPAACGIVLFRLPMPRAAEAGAVLADRLPERTDWVGHFSVVQPGRVRMRPLAAR